MNAIEMIFRVGTFILSFAFLLTARVLFLISDIHSVRKAPKKRTEPCKVCIVLGSGGHTTEMFRILRPLPRQTFRPRLYVVAETDTLSVAKIYQFEESQGCAEKVDFEIRRISRSREVRQSWLTSVFTTARAGECFNRSDERQVLCNGPGTCVPVCLVAFLIRALCLKRIPIVFVESFARVEHLSLTGKILYPIADRFLIQWPNVKTKYPRAEYLGTLL